MTDFQKQKDYNNKCLNRKNNFVNSKYLKNIFHKVVEINKKYISVTKDNRQWMKTANYETYTFVINIGSSHQRQFGFRINFSKQIYKEYPEFNISENQLYDLCFNIIKEKYLNRLTEDTRAIDELDNLKLEYKLKLFK